MSTPLPASRRQAILRQILHDGEAQVGALAASLGVSAITVRRDIAALAEEGLVEQVRGGARRLDPVRRRPAPAAEAAPAGIGPGDPARPRARIAMVVPSLRYYWPAIVQGAVAAADELGADLFVHGTNSDADENRAVVEQIIAGTAVDALIIGPDPTDSSARDRLVALLASLPLPVIIAERRIEGHGPLGRAFDTVRSDHSMGGAAAVRHLAQLGHRRLALAYSPSPSAPFVAAGYARAVELLGLDEAAPQGREIRPYGKNPFIELDRALDEIQDRGTTAMLVHADTTAALIVQHAARRGLAVPGDLSVIAYDDELAVSARPALTAVAPAKAALGRRAVELALRRLAQPDAPVEHVLLMPELRIRDTTSPPR